MTRLLMSFVLLGSLSLGACNTFQGMSRDSQETGDFVTGTHPRDAYHWDARDF